MPLPFAFFSGGQPPQFGIKQFHQFPCRCRIALTKGTHQADRVANKAVASLKLRRHVGILSKTKNLGGDPFCRPAGPLWSERTEFLQDFTTEGVYVSKPDAPFSHIRLHSRCH